MCGRKYASEELTWAEYREVLDIIGPAQTNLQPHFNITPTMTYPICYEKDGLHVLQPARWWLVPAWAKETQSKYPMFNARDDKLETANSWKPLIKTNRCVVMVSGFYEWTGEKGSKQPWQISPPDRAPMIFPGLWSYNDHLDTYSYATITTEPSPFFERFHRRQAAILEPDAVETWLSGPWEEAKALIAPHAGELLVQECVDPRATQSHFETGI